MSYHEAVRAPACSDEEAQRLRDLWRPSIQADYTTMTQWEGGDASGRLETVRMPDPYDPTKTPSLSLHGQMYVVPPAIAEPFMQELDEHLDGPFFEERGGWQEGVRRGAEMFVDCYVPNWAFNPVNRDSVRTRATKEFDGRGYGAGRIAPLHLGVDAPAIERNIPYARDEFGDTRRREGIFGWTVPRIKHEYPYGCQSLLVVNPGFGLAHIIPVHWYEGPAERLSLTFRYPRLNEMGRAALTTALTDLEELLPRGTNYDDVYKYHPRTPQEGSYGTEWSGTEEWERKIAREHSQIRSRRRWAW